MSSKVYLILVTTYPTKAKKIDNLKNVGTAITEMFQTLSVLSFLLHSDNWVQLLSLGSHAEPDKGLFVTFLINH